MDTPPPIRDATSEDIDDLTNILAEAFNDDPVYRWFLREDAKSVPVLRRIIEQDVRHYVPKDECHITESLDGATLWLPPRPLRETTAPTLWKRLQALRGLAGISGIAKVRRLMYLISLTKAKRPDEPHYYLHLIGVCAHAKGRGIGSALLRKMLEQCDSENALAYLENSNERNLPLYTRHGVEVREHIELPWGGPGMWFMERTPR